MFETHLELHHPLTGNPILINYFWLRDHCRCSQCYATDTNQRTINILDIPLDIRPTETNIVGDHVTIQCKHNNFMFI